MSADSVHSKLTPRDKFVQYITEAERESLLASPLPQVLNGLLCAFKDLPIQTRQEMAKDMISLSMAGRLIPEKVDLFYSTLVELHDPKHPQAVTDESVQAMMQWVGISEGQTLSIVTGSARALKEHPVLSEEQQKLIEKLKWQLTEKCKRNPSAGNVPTIVSYFARHIKPS